MYIPELKYTFYGPIVLMSIVIGIIVACVLMKRAGVKKETLIYTAILTFISILVFSFIISINLSGDIRKVGFVGAGGALGLIMGAIISALIHRDHTGESIAAWIVVAPLMYGLSKIACHIAGCCNGIPYTGLFKVSYGMRDGASFFPVQLTETFVFLIIFIIGFAMYSKMENKLKVAEIVLMLSMIGKVGLEFLRESHMGAVISNYQILVCSIALSGCIAIHFISRLNNDRTNEKNAENTTE